MSVPGTWNIVSNVLASKCAYRTKLTYWRQDFDWRKDKPELTVVAKRFDRDEPLLIAEKANAFLWEPTYQR